MNPMLWRVLVVAIVLGMIFVGVRRIWRDWTRSFRQVDAEKRQRERERDLAERTRADVIELKRSDDGVFRPGEERDRRD
ncbi:hypothetical protein EMQ25_09740 [Arsenicitalea aurantiaca]|uniref:Uncharacterized protein n=1 Tax=Arsenicitalea aurantiaca TaxID=1783274 RepID=A0A433XAQ7_9HYPH|nr:hypothetical protein [Arsenicitalea aurantiaca]RUT31142.1 hypothetical protein EMQ25_09740 [Arsenicitalea aurantiaca]